jgi:menaquinol-cytochrome c reductase cytochrome b/c subunit
VADIPEHLLKRSAERRKALGLPAKDGDPAGDAPAGEAAPEPGGDAPAEAPAPAAAAASDAGAVTESVGGVPAHLLERARKRKAVLAGEDPGAATGGGGGGTAVATATIATPAMAPPATASGPGGHTQRLLTVVKAGSIQQTKSSPVDKVHVWPHLLVAEFACTMVLLALITIFSALVRAPLQGLADTNQTPNPSKAPWYFLGLQELLTMFHPMVAGVTIPGIGIFLLILAPYLDRNTSNKPGDRKYMISMMTMFMMFWAVLVIIGSFFRGQGFNFSFPWDTGIFFEL